MVLQPLMLADGSSPVVVARTDATAWSAWFGSCGRLLRNYACHTQREGVSGPVTGMNIRRAAWVEKWAQLIAELRQICPEELGDVALNTDARRAFAHGSLLGDAGVTLYSSMRETSSAEGMQARSVEILAEPRLATTEPGSSSCRAEVGIHSRRGTEAVPQQLHYEPGVVANVELQAISIDPRLTAPEGDVLRCVSLWSWCRKPRSGSVGDSGYDLQNKPVLADSCCRG